MWLKSCVRNNVQSSEPNKPNRADQMSELLCLCDTRRGFLYHTTEEHLPSHHLYCHDVHQTHRACAISAAVRPGLIFSVGHIFHTAGSLTITRIQTFHLLLGQSQLVHKRETRNRGMNEETSYCTAKNSKTYLKHIDTECC